LIKYSCVDFVFEFGGGKSLVQNLFLSNNVNHQLVVDLYPMIDIKIVDQSRSLLYEIGILKSNLEIRSINDLLSYGIEYIAPYDASKIDLLDETLDACISTNTLEHIPEDSIKNIFKELFRVLKVKGILSIKIDYSDHYSHTDSSIGKLNFLYFSDFEWKKYNHNCHFQNRLRHKEYYSIFVSSGFQVLSEYCYYDEEHISDDFRQLHKKEEMQFFATSGYFVLGKNG
jgi:SAM-dependent methyltransferase